MGAARTRSVRKMSRARVAFGLLCGLAICCSVMYITSDGAEEIVAASEGGATAHSLYGDGPKSVSSEDVQKAGTIFTNTPDGRMRLTDYLSNVEKEIAAEEAARKRDVEAVREQMDRNMAFNAAARSRLEKMLRHKMAVNAKFAADNLKRAMRFVQARFAYYAMVSNKREKLNAAKQVALRKQIAKDKKDAADNLQNAVLVQQRAMSALKTATNAKITKTNKHVSANAAQIKSDAETARKSLDKAVHEFDKKAANARALAAAGRSKLAAQLEDQDKKIRQWANNKLKIVVAKTQAEFARVRAKMAADRQHADMALKAASSRMDASLNAEAALESKRFSENMKDIAAAKAEAAKRVKDAKIAFKSKIMLLRATVNKQVAATNARMTALSGVVEKNKVAQAKVNSNVEAEMKRMISIGNKRYKEHLKKDKELGKLVAANKAANDARMKAMAAHYAMELDAVRATMKKNRAHASKMLSKKTAALYTAIAKSEKEQSAKNKALNSQLQASRLDIADSLRAAKEDFTKRMTSLHETVAKNDRKFQGKMLHLTGVVKKNEEHNKAARAALAATMKANKEDLLSSVSDAVRKGEARMAKAEGKLKSMNAKTKQMLNMKITSAITKQEKRANAQLEGIRLNSKENRAIMKKEMLFAVRASAAIAKTNLADAVKDAKATFLAAFDDEAKSATMNAAARAALSAKIAACHKTADYGVAFAVMSLQKALLALHAETRKPVGKKDKSITAYADSIKGCVKKSNDEMTAIMTALLAKVGAAEKGAKAAAAANLAAAMKEVKKSLEKGQKEAASKFNDAFLDLADARADADEDLAEAVTKMNDSIAKSAALADARFSKTVKNINAARKQATTQVSNARKFFATALANLISTIALTETKLSSVVNTATGAQRSLSAFQTLMQRRIGAELKRVTSLTNAKVSDSVRARGKLKAILNENKRAAAAETAALNALFVSKIDHIRASTSKDVAEMLRDLSASSEKLYDLLQGIQLKAAVEGKGTAEGIAAEAKASAAEIASTTDAFDSAINTVTNAMVANSRSVMRGFAVLTGVFRGTKDVSKFDRKLLATQAKVIVQDMLAKLVLGVTHGETKAKRVAQRARIGLAGAKKALLLEVSEQVESAADDAFAKVQASHQKVADNYLSLKAYAVSAENKISNYVIKGKGMNLSSLGDLLVSINQLSAVTVPMAAGVGAGEDSIPSIFSGESIAVDPKSSKINGLVDEYTGVTSQVRMRYPLGLGKYLLLKVEEAMLGKGVLMVDKVADKAGNFVFLNGHAVGLSNKLNDLEELAVRMADYEATLSKLTAKMSAKTNPAIQKPKVMVPPPEWPGN